MSEFSIKYMLSKHLYCLMEFPTFQLFTTFFLPFFNFLQNVLKSKLRECIYIYSRVPLTRSFWGTKLGHERVRGYALAVGQDRGQDSPPASQRVSKICLNRKKSPKNTYFCPFQNIVLAFRVPYFLKSKIRIYIFFLILATEIFF